ANRWGLLNLCTHNRPASHSPPDAFLAMMLKWQDGTFCLPVGFAEGRQTESIAVWRAHARHAATIVEAIAVINGLRVPYVSREGSARNSDELLKQLKELGLIRSDLGEDENKMVEQIIRQINPLLIHPRWSDVPSADWTATRLSIELDVNQW